METRSAIISVRVCPGILKNAEAKLEIENQKNYATAKNKRFVTKKSIADLVENSLLEYIYNE